METRNVSAVTLSRGAALGPSLGFDDGDAAPDAAIIPQEMREFELNFLKSAVKNSVIELREIAIRVTAEMGAENADIFEGHADITEDPDFFAEMETSIQTDGHCAEWAARTVAEKNALEMEELEDEYLRERGEDFRDIGKRIASHVRVLRSGISCDNSIFPPFPAIIVCESLSPAQTVCFHLPHVLGFVVCSGGSTSHAAILARSLAIPAVRVGPQDLKTIKNGEILLVNILKDFLVINPNAAARVDAEKKIIVERERRVALEVMEIGRAHV